MVSRAAGWTVMAAVHGKRGLEMHCANFRGQAIEVDMPKPTQAVSLIEHPWLLDVDLMARKELWTSSIDTVVTHRPRPFLLITCLTWQSGTISLS